MLDYKSGKRVDDSMLWHGFDLQLPLYCRPGKMHLNGIPGSGIIDYLNRF